MKTVSTPKGTQLPLIQLKGKDYLQVAHRLIWFNEVVPKFDINTQFLHLDDDQTVCKAVIVIRDDNNNIVRSATATKRETKKDFPDHTEKAETGSIGRCLAQLGFGTQFALADLDEGSRIVDAPVMDIRTNTVDYRGVNNTAIVAPSVTFTTDQVLPSGSVQGVVTSVTELAPKTSFRKPPRPSAPAVAKDESGFG